ncbi:MAG TPA: cytochrome c [Stellaceae bacterium]|nr:cytochrome c [Stellaceae bacterium]
MQKLISVVALLSLVSIAHETEAQEASHTEDVAAGQKIAVIGCSACHVVEVNQEIEPILRPPAPSFASIANRPGMTEETVRNFLNNTHGTLANSKNMPNPRLMDFQVRQVAAFLMTLRTKP